MLDEELIGLEVIYTSGSGKEYVAIVTHIDKPSDPKARTLPSVSLLFHNNRNKAERRKGVPPAGSERLMTWKPYPEGVRHWRRMPDGQTHFCEEP